MEALGSCEMSKHSRKLLPNNPDQFITLKPKTHVRWLGTWRGKCWANKGMPWRDERHDLRNDTDDAWKWLPTKAVDKKIREPFASCQEVDRTISTGTLLQVSRNTSAYRGRQHSFLWRVIMEETAQSLNVAYKKKQPSDMSAEMYLTRHFVTTLNGRYCVVVI
jgi:hypothetical protein